MAKIPRGGVGWGCMLRRAAGGWFTVVLLLVLASESAWATAPGTNGPIAFMSGAAKIYTIQPDGSGLHPIVLPDDEHKLNHSPSWSPDGQRVVTSGEMLDPESLHYIQGLQVFSADGTNFAHLPIPPFTESPAWSPGGAHILFVQDRKLLSTTPDGAVPTIIETDAWSPAWSPDGRQISFVRPNGPYLDTDLYTMNTDGSGARAILDPSGIVSSPSWSPDGSMIAFTYRAREVRAEPGPGQLPYTYSGPNIYAVPAAGGQPVQLTDSGTDRYPAWSPDGSMIVFQSERLSVFPQGASYLYLMNADGSDERRLTTVTGYDPDWASLPPHSRPPAAASAATVPTHEAEPSLRTQAFLGVAMTRTRFARLLRVWISFEAAVAEKVGFTIRRTTPRGSAFRCSTEPSPCLLIGQDERQAQEGLNRISLGSVLGGTPNPGRYWLQLTSPSGDAHAGLAFRVMPQRHKQRHRCRSRHRSSCTPSG